MLQSVMTTFAPTSTTMTYAEADVNGTSAGSNDSVTTQAFSEKVLNCYIYQFTVNTVIIGTLCIVGLLGNSVAFLVFWKDNIKTSTSFLFQALSFVDSVLLILVLPVYCVGPLVDYPGIFRFYRKYIEAFVLVYVFPLCALAQTATIWTTVLVAINRYIAVCKPYQASRLCTVIQAKKQFAVIFVCTVLYNIPFYFEGRVSYDNKTQMYAANYTPLGKNPTFFIIYHIIMYLLFMLAVPLLILTILNILLIRALKEIRKRRAEMQSLRQQQDNNVTLVLIIVVLVFSVCQAPALVNQICWLILPEISRECGGFQFYFRRVTNVLVITNSAVNFLIYFIFNTRFRQVLMENICKREYRQGYHKQRNHSTTNHHHVTDGTRDTLL